MIKVHTIALIPSTGNEMLCDSLQGVPSLVPRHSRDKQKIIEISMEAAAGHPPSNLLPPTEQYTRDVIVNMRENNLGLDESSAKKLNF